MRRLAPLLALGLFACVAHAKPHSSQKSSPPIWPAVELDHLSTHERFFLRPDRRGHLGKKQLRGLTRFLRCHHTGRVHAIAGRLPLLLYAVAHHFGDHPVSVVAGYRAPRIAREKGNPSSPHKSGLACDFRIEGVELTALRDFLRRGFDGIGVGYYPNANFVHLDVGRKRCAFWIDYSRPGERARYSSDAEGDLRSGTVEVPPPGSAAASSEANSAIPDGGQREIGESPPSDAAR